MSKSIHITKRNFKDFSKNELEQQAKDPNSELREWAHKSELKKEVKNKRKSEKNN